MWRSKKFIIGTVLAALILAGSIGGVALASEGEEESLPDVQCGIFIDEVCEIYNAENPEAPIDCEELTEAFYQARSEMHPEGLRSRFMMGPEDMQSRLDALLEQGEITQEQYDEMLERWQSRADGADSFGFRSRGGFGGFRGTDGGFCFGDPPAPAE